MNGKSLQNWIAQDLCEGQTDLSGNMFDHESDTFLSYSDEQRKETDVETATPPTLSLLLEEVQDKPNDIRRHLEKKELLFNSVEDIFGYLGNVDEVTWARMAPLISSKAHNLKACLEPHPGSTVQQTGNSKALTENWYRSCDVTASRFVKPTSKKTLAIVALVFFVLWLVFCILFAVNLNKNQPCDGVSLPRSAPPCPPHWFWYQRRCYYFSEGEKNWTSSQDFCSTYDASLARITDEEKDFIHLLKGRDSFWIGLIRSPGQPWKWLNGDDATLEVFGDGGDCAFLDNEFRVISSRCRTTFRWMCSKADASEKPNESEKGSDMVNTQKHRTTRESQKIK